MIIVLIGYMGSGKSIVGQELAAKLGYVFEDLDNYIEARESHSISEIFATKGELYFRKIETQYLSEMMSKDRNIVLALGGGTPCYGNNIDRILMHKNSLSIFLRTSVTSLLERLKHEKRKRPLVAHISSEDELAEFIGKHLFERSGFYNRAEIIVDTDDKSVDEIVETIVLQLF